MLSSPTMVNLRNTAKLNKRLGLGRLEKVPSSGVLFREWHANLITVDRVPLIIAVEERTRLPILVRARDLHRLPQHLATTLRDFLIRLGVEETIAEGYGADMTSLSHSATNDRSVIATMNDFAKLLKWRAAHGPKESLVEMMDELAKTPTGPIDLESPGRYAVACIRFDPAAN